jgi:hypothetical protein
MEILDRGKIVLFLNKRRQNLGLTIKDFQINLFRKLSMAKTHKARKILINLIKFSNDGFYISGD